MSGRLLGYPDVSARLQRELAQGRVSHAYLVSGPPQVGKMVLAQDLAAALNCEDSQTPCGLCPQCQKTLALAHPDVQVLRLQVDQKSDRLRKEIGIDQVRTLQHDASLHPYWGRYRIFIVDEAHRLSSEAANCLLKTLEEPPSACIIILLATDECALPSTVLSRCRKVHLRPLSVARIETVLLELGASSEQARLLAHLSGGRLGWAISARGDARLLNARAGILDAMKRGLEEGLPERFRLAEEMASLYYKDRGALETALETWLRWWRDVLLVGAGYSRGISNTDHEEGLGHWSGQLSLVEILTFIKDITDTMEHLERNVNPRMALEALVLQAPGRA